MAEPAALIATRSSGDRRLSKSMRSVGNIILFRALITVALPKEGWRASIAQCTSCLSGSRFKSNPLFPRCSKFSARTPGAPRYKTEPPSWGSFRFHQAMNRGYPEFRTSRKGGLRGCFKTPVSHGGARDEKSKERGGDEPQ